MNDTYYYTNSKGEVVEATYEQVEQAAKHYGYPDTQTYLDDKGITTDPPAKKQEVPIFSGEETKDAVDNVQAEETKIQTERDNTRLADLDNRIANEKPKVNKSMSQIVREAKMKETTEKAIELDDAHTWMDNVDDVQFSNASKGKMAVMLNEAYPGFTAEDHTTYSCLLYTSPSPRDATLSRMPSSA